MGKDIGNYDAGAVTGVRQEQMNYSRRLVIDASALERNIDRIKGMTEGRIIAVLKGNGFGVGLLEYAAILAGKGIDFFAVFNIEEATALRAGGFGQDILLLSATSLPWMIESAIDNNVILSVGTEEGLAQIRSIADRRGCAVRVHIKIDSGFGRFGFLPEACGALAPKLLEASGVSVEGTYSHFSTAFAEKPQYTLAQFETFNRAVQILEQGGIKPGMRHIVNSNAFLRFPQMHMEAVRIGSAFLGRIPAWNRRGLERLLYLKSEIIEVKQLPAKHFVGYSNTYRTKEPCRIGIVPVGYKDGFGVEKAPDTFRLRDVLRYTLTALKSAGSRLTVQVDGKRTPVLGRIGMCNIVVDLTGHTAGVGSEVLLEVNPLMVDGIVPREFVYDNGLR